MPSIHETLTRGPTSHFQDTIGCLNRKKMEMHRMTPEWNWTHQKYPICTKYLSPLLYNQLFSRYKVVKNRNIGYIHRITCNWHSKLGIIGGLYTLTTYPRGSNLSPFALRPYFLDIAHLLKRGKRMLKLQNIKIRNSKFRHSFIKNCYRKHEFWGVNLMCTFKGDIVWKFYSHMVTC